MSQMMRQCFLVRSSMTVTTNVKLPARYGGQDCRLSATPAVPGLPPPVCAFPTAIFSQHNQSVCHHRPDYYSQHDYRKIRKSPSFVASCSDQEPKDKLERNSNEEDNKDPFKASNEQLAELREKLSRTLPYFFSRPHDFSVYNRDIIFEDNIRQVKTVGLNPYAWEITKIKMGAHMKYGKVVLNILKITHHPEDSTIKIRWRIVTYPGNQVVLAFWKFKLWNQKESLEQYKDEWIDGFSIFHVGGDGLIYKHVCDKVIPDTDNVKKSSSPTEKLAEKLGMA